MAKFVFFLLGLALIQTSFALKCKKCASSTDCELATLIDDTCQVPSKGFKVGCLTEVDVDSAKKQTVIRKCISFPDSQEKAACVVPPGSKTDICDTCFSDLCNNGFKLNPQSVVMLTVTSLVALIAPRIL